MPPSVLRITNRAFLALTLTGILTATLYPAGGRDQAPLVLCIVCGEDGLSDALTNLILFVPLGAGLALGAWSRRSVILGAGVLSAGIECAQLIIPGRDPSIGDVLFNTLGGAAGLAVVHTAKAWLVPATVRVGRRLLATASVTATVVFLATGLLLAPSLPDSTYFIQWTPNLGHLVWYRARVSKASLGDLSLPHRRLNDAAALRRRLLAGDPLVVNAVAGHPTGGVGSLLSIYDDRQREILLIGPDRADFTFRLRRRAADVRLDEPDLRLLGAMRHIARSDTLAVVLRRESRSAWCLAVNHRSACGLGFTLGRAWALLMHPESFPEWLRRLLDAGWMAGVLVPFGLWARRDRVSLVAGVALVVVVVTVSPATGLRPLTVLEWCGAAAGIGLGVAVARVARRASAAAAET